MNEAEKSWDPMAFYQGRIKRWQLQLPSDLSVKEQKQRGHVQRTFGSKRQESTRHPVKVSAERLCPKDTWVQETIKTSLVGNGWRWLLAKGGSLRPEVGGWEMLICHSHGSRKVFMPKTRRETHWLKLLLYKGAQQTSSWKVSYCSGSHTPQTGGRDRQEHLPSKLATYKNLTL